MSSAVMISSGLSCPDSAVTHRSRRFRPMLPILFALVLVLGVLAVATGARADDAAEARRLGVLGKLAYDQAMALDLPSERVPLLTRSIDQYQTILERYPQTEMAVKVAAGEKPVGVSLGQIKEALKLAKDPGMGQNSLPRRLARGTAQAMHAVGEATIHVGQVLSQLSRDTGLGSPLGLNTQLLLRSLMPLTRMLMVIIVTALAWFVVWRLLRRPLRLLGERGQGAEPGTRVGLGASRAALEAGGILTVWGAGTLFALFIVPPSDLLIESHSIFLNAFLLVEAAKLVARLVLQPEASGLRLIASDDESAEYAYVWCRRFIQVLGYGFAFLIPAAASLLPPILIRLLRFILALPVAGMLVMLVLQARQVVRDRLAGPIRSGVWYRLRLLTARIWHVPALTLVVAGLVFFLANPDEAPRIMAAGLGWTLLILLATRGLIRILDTAIDRIFSLNAQLRQRFPLLEKRVNRFLPLMHGLLRLVVSLASLVFILKSWHLDAVADWLTTPTGQGVLEHISSIVLTLVLAVALWLVASTWIEYKLRPSDDRKPNARLATLLVLFRNALTVCLVVVTTMMVLSELGVDIGPLIAGAGVIGLAVGFGSQKLVQDVITGLFIQMENSFNTGDFIQVAGISGTVERLSIRSVAIRDTHGAFHIIPFSATGAISNHTRDFANYVDDIGVGYGENLDAVYEALGECYRRLAAEPRWAGQILAPMTIGDVSALADSSVNIRITIRTKPGIQWALGRAFRKHVKDLFDERGIELPFPQRTISFAQTKDDESTPERTRLEEAAQKS